MGFTPPVPAAPAPPPSDNGGGVQIPPPPPARAAQASAALPRVDYWAIWNEPNHPGWLTPQWTQDGGRWSEAAPRVYRGLADAAWGALQGTGHGQDTILVGETAPKGLVTRRGTTRGIDPLRFIRALYCVDRALRPLRGTAARAASAKSRRRRTSGFTHAMSVFGRGVSIGSPRSAASVCPIPTMYSIGARANTATA